MLRVLTRLNGNSNMASQSNNPFKRYKKAAKGKKLSGEEVHEMMKKKSFNVGKVKHTGSFGGKSNALGHGGRAAQLKARGVPGGVIGNMARSVGAAPGGPNFHGKKSKKRKSSTINRGEEGDVEMKKSNKRKGVIGFADVEQKRSKKRKMAPHFPQHLKHRKSSKKRKGYEGSKLDERLDRITGFKEGSKKDEEMDKVIAPHVKKSAHHKCKGATCKHAEHQKGYKRSKKV